MPRNAYRFASTWRVDAPSRDAFRALREVRDYPSWWPQVRSARPVDDDTVELVARSFLPCDLRFTTQQVVADEAAGVLEARLRGDLDGFSRWTISSDGPGSRLDFAEEVVVTKALLQRLEPVARLSAPTTRS